MIVSLNLSASEKCELTDQYKKVRTQATLTVYGDDNDYSRCKNATRNFEYWAAFSKCVKNEGKNTGSRCAHAVNSKKYRREFDVTHCEVFKFEPSKELAQKLIDESVKIQGIEKCKK